LRSEGFDDEAEETVDYPIPVMAENHTHICEMCDEEDHGWVCEDELCTLGRVVACPKVRGKYKAAK